MAKTLTQFATDIHAYLGKGKVKQARKAWERATKSGFEGNRLGELELEVLLAEGKIDAAAESLTTLAGDAANRLAGSLTTVDVHLRANPEHHVLRDALWEVALSREAFELACRNLSELVRARGVDGNARTKALLGRKDAVGATGIFLLASLGAIQVDRIKLADRLFENERGAILLKGTVEALHATGNEDGAINYVLAKIAKRGGDTKGFLEYAGRAFEENPEEVWTWTESNAAPTELLEIAARKGLLRHLLRAAGKASSDAIVDVAKRADSAGTTGATLRAMALLAQGKTRNACRVLEKVVIDDPASSEELAAFLSDTRHEWRGTHITLAAVLGAEEGDAKRLGRAADALLQEKDERDEAWVRVAERIAPLAPERDDLRLELGAQLLRDGNPVGAAALIEVERHLEIAAQWARDGLLSAGDPAEILRGAASIAEAAGATAEHADWILTAAQSDAELLAELGRELSGGATVSVGTALTSAQALSSRGASKQAAELLCQLPLDPETGKALDEFLRENKLADSKEFATVSFRSALGRGDAPAARRLFDRASGNVQALTREAARHAEAARVLAEILIEHDKAEVIAPLLEERRDAGDNPRTLLPLVDSLLKKSPKLAMGRLLRGRLLHAMQRDRDAVRDLSSLLKGTGQSEAAFDLLGEMLDGEAAGPASLGRADILLSRGDALDAVQELVSSNAPPAERLQRFERICEDHANRDAAQRGRAALLQSMGRLPEAAATQLLRFRCADAERRAVAEDVEALAREALMKGDLETVEVLLAKLSDEVSDGAERAVAVIADDKRAQMLVLRARLFLELDRPEEAVRTLVDLVHTDPKSRKRAAEALGTIVESGRARPDADFALAEAHRVSADTAGALAALVRLYEDDLTERQNVFRAATGMVQAGDDPDVRLFLSRIALDMREPAQATEHAVHARRLRPDSRREVIDVMRRALDLDAFAAETHFALGEAHLAGDEADDAVRHMRAAVEVDRDRAGDAIKVLEEAAQRSKSAAHLFLAVGTTHAEFLRDHKRAVTAFTSGLEANPPSELRVPLLLGRGDAYAALRADDQAYTDFEEASHLDRLERRYYEFLRVTHRKRVARAAEESREKVRDNGEFAAAVDACGRFIRLGKVDDAVSVAQAALAADKGAIAAKYLVGVALHAAERYGAAVQVLEAVRGEAGADSEIGRAARMLLAESYLDRGDRTDARACLTEIESVDAEYPGLRARRAALAPPADDPQAPPPLLVRPVFPRPSE